MKKEVPSYIRHDQLFQQFVNLRGEQKKSKQEGGEFSINKIAEIAELNQRLGLKYSAWNSDLLVSRKNRLKKFPDSQSKHS